MESGWVEVKKLSIGSRISIQMSVFIFFSTLVLLLLVNLQLRNYAVKMAEDKARLILAERQATIHYVVNNLRPPLFDLLKQQKIRSSYFEPAWMSAGYINRKIMGYLYQDEFSDFYYKNAAINARSPENEADSIEKEFLLAAEDSKDIRIETGVHHFNSKPFYVYLKTNTSRFEKVCMKCHSTPENAPADLIELYGDQRSFGKKPGDIASVLSLRIPLDSVYENINALTLNLFIIICIFSGLFFLLQWLVTRAVIVNPLKKVTRKAIALSEDDSLLGEGIRIENKGELTDLAHSFSRMSRRLSKTKQELENEVQRKTRQLTDANSRLKQSETLYRNIYDNAQVGLFRARVSDGKIMMANNRLAEMFGYASARDCVDDYVAVEHYVVPRIRGKMVASLKATGRIDNFETQIRRQDGSQVWIAFSGKLSDDPDFYEGIAIDIDQKRKAQEALQRSRNQFESILSNIQCVTYRCKSDTDRTMLYISHHVDRLTGVPPSEFITDSNRHYMDIIHPEDQSRVKDEMNLAIIQNRPWELEYRIIHTDGSERWVHDKGGGVRDAKGHVHYLDGFIINITEKKILEAQVQQTQKLEAIGTLAGGIAHDFNNILFPILGHTELLLTDIDESDPGKEGLDEILSAALRARELIKQILTFSRVEKTKLMELKIPLIVKEALKLIRSTLPTTVEIVQEIQSDCGKIKADPTQIHQIIMNLSTNAYHAMEETGGTLTVGLEEIILSHTEAAQNDLLPGNYACLTLSDTGYGIEKQVLDKIFDPFFTTKKKEKGTGLGLSMVHGIVTQLNGAVQVSSKVNEGTEFTILLPVAKPVETKFVPDLKPAVSGGSERILLIDDEKPILKMGKSILKKYGYRVTAFSGSLEALEYFKENPYAVDLVITDLTMPKLAGDQLSLELLKIRPNLPIIICTGYSKRLNQQTISKIGIKAILMKPVIGNEFIAKIKEILDEVKSAS